MIILLAVCFALCPAGVTVAAQTDDGETVTRARVERFRDWQVVYVGESGNPGQTAGCFASHSSVVKGETTVLATINLYRNGRTQAPVAIVKVPTGVSLVSGIAWRHTASGDVVSLEWQYCTPETCLARITLSADEVARLKAGREFELAYRPLPGSRILSVPVSLLGFTRAYERLEACPEDVP